jgi:hypothetical protein
MKNKQIFAFLLMNLCWLSSIFAGNPFIASAMQGIENSNGQLLKSESLFTSGTLITILEVHDETEKITIKFVADHWLDLTSRITVSGSGVTFSKFLSKGTSKTMQISSGQTFAGNFAYCEAEFNISSSAGIGDRTVTLFRPNMTFGEDKETFTFRVKKSARILSIGLTNGSSAAKNDGTRTDLQASVQGFDENITFKTSQVFLDNPVISSKGKFVFNFTTAFKKSGVFGPGDLENALNISGAVELIAAYNTNASITVTNTTPIVSRSRNPPSGGVVIGGGSGSILIGGGGGNGRTADLSVTFLSTFRSSGTNFVLTETGTYSLCPTKTNPNISTINDLTIRIQNLGTANSNACTVQFSRNSNTNFNSDLTFNIPVLTPGQQINFVVPRIESKVCATKNGTGACIRCGNGIQGINHWNDKGASAQILGITGDSNTSNNSQTIF